MHQRGVGGLYKEYFPVCIIWNVDRYRELVARSSSEFKHVDKMAEWKDLCLHEDVEELILARLRSCALSARMLAGVQSELVSRREVGPGAGRVDKVATEFVKKTGRYSNQLHIRQLHVRCKSFFF